MLRLIIRRLIRLFGAQYLAKSGTEIFLKGVEELNEYEFTTDENGNRILIKNEEQSEEDNDDAFFNESSIYALRQHYEIKKHMEQEYDRMRQKTYVYEDDDAEMSELEFDIPEAPEEEEEEQVEMESI
ncbi:MAG: hypothetical protein J6L05_02080 [Ruminococcus sp.]|nr:hypothetical protein [Ruminococcus sp.]